MSTEYTFSVPGIMCGSCVKAINEALKPPRLLSRMKQYFIADENIITIEKANANESGELKVTIVENGLTSDVVMKALNAKLPSGLQCSHITAEQPPSKVLLRLLLGFIGVSAGLALLILPLVMTGLPILTMALIGIASTMLTVTLGAASYKKAASIFFMNGGLHMDTLFTVSTLAAIGVSIAAFFVPGLPMMFEVGLLIFGFRHIGEGIRESLENRMGFKERFQDRAAKKVEKLMGETSSEVLSKDLVVGDVIVIEAGMVVPVDGICQSGVGNVSTDIDDGLDQFKLINPEDVLLAGMTLMDGSIQMKVTAAVSESLLARKDASIAASINKKDEKSSWETQANKYLRYFIPGVFLLAITSGVLIGCFFSPALAIQCAVGVLVSACPCTLGLVTGMAVKVGMRKASEQGILFKSTQKLERVFQIEHVVFDLNGTLTTLTPVVVENGMHLAKKTLCTKDELLGLFLSIESFSRKSIAAAICEYAKDKGAKPSIALDASQIDLTNHNGVKASIDGQVYCIGNAQMMEDNNVIFDEKKVEYDQTVIYLSRGATVLGHIIVQRPLRPEAIDVVSALQKMGKKVYIYSGADEATVKAYANVLGIPTDNLEWGCSSSRKPKDELIRKLQKSGRVAMIGDAGNDAEAIAASDFGVAMPIDGEPRPNISRQLAEAEFKTNSLKPIVPAFDISRQTASNINQNFMFSLTYNIAVVLLSGGLLLAAGIVLNPSIGVALMILQTSIILLNTYRFKQQKVIGVSETFNETSSYGASMKKLKVSKQSSSKNSATLSQSSNDTLLNRLDFLFSFSKKPSRDGQGAETKPSRDRQGAETLISGIPITSVTKL